MKAVKFKESNFVLKSPDGLEDDVYDLDVWKGETGGLPEFISKWRPSFRERLSILFFGSVWLRVMSRTTSPPVLIQGAKTVFKK
jgi:hypothetical protein